MQIGAYSFDMPFILAPMAGITDQPFRDLCLDMGADLTVSEMLWADAGLCHSKKTRCRMATSRHKTVQVVQIAGSEPECMAQAARFNVEQGADIIDINMGCPAKKVNKKKAGSALMQYPQLVEEILTAVVRAVHVPVTLKIRTGWCPENRNGVEIAKIAQSCGIQALTVHGRTRACMFKGQAEYTTIQKIKQTVSIPVIANGDIDSIDKAEQVLAYTGADALMIGRAAQGNPWIFQQLKTYFKYGKCPEPPSLKEQCRVLLSHIQGLYALYGAQQGTHIARKHVGWYLKEKSDHQTFRKYFNTLPHASAQCEALENYFHSIY